MKYEARMSSWVHEPDYPISKGFNQKVTAMQYIRRALNIYPYVKITLYKCTMDENCVKDGSYSINKKGKIMNQKR
jgi:hypothetical protein